MKFLVAYSILVAATLAEPPVDTRYLPPQNAGISQTYGAPGFGSGRQTDAIFGRQSSFSGSRASSRRPSSQYGPPSALYGAPNAAQQTPSAVYGVPSSDPSTQYGAPAPSALYGAPQIGGHSGSPSQLYGAPGVGGAGFGAEQSKQYLPPGAGRGYDDGSNGEPANYNFEYMVEDAASGNDFGHREARLGERAEGLYYVVLPDGRKQTVEYEADEGGYKPKISYEETGRGAYRSGQGYVNGGYSQGGPY
ncbi:hypothetical protein O3G_MSEX011148 [Manduca sexta]|uniref:Pro-resilin n=1 Tax=Manduca sexta TaxID=7130 RepID=A0A922CUP5_MANSE|nr:hypothetical protein O3G_MSEX011148 [Manduca sexta]